MAGIGTNDVLRVGLELAALASLAYWGWTATAGAGRIVLAAGLPLVAAALWGTFRGPGDPGPAPVAVSGPVRLALEFVLFGTAVVALAVAGRPVVGAALGSLVVVHYLIARERVRWLLGGGAG